VILEWFRAPDSKWKVIQISITLCLLSLETNAGHPSEIVYEF